MVAAAGHFDFSHSTQQQMYVGKQQDKKSRRKNEKEIRFWPDVIAGCSACVD